jgi:ribosome biogenesis GTPase
MSDLRALGWDEGFAAAFVPFAAQGLEPGRVVLEHNHVYRVGTADGEVLAEAGGRIKYLASGRHELPAVGDWVALRRDPARGRALIRAILPRRTWFSRKVAGRVTAEQVVAANIDVLWLVFSAESAIKPRSVERYLVLARRSGARPVVILNKADLCPDVPQVVADATAAAGDAPVHAVSARTAAGLGSVQHYLAPGRTLAMLGPSGAGKSSLINRLAGRDLLATGEVREWDLRGRHTSVHRQLVMLDAGGVVIDTPGMREVQLWEADEAVDETFADIASLAAACRFRDCLHDREPDCAVKAAVAAGRLDDGRYESYLKLQRERREVDARREERDQLESKRQAKVQQKALKGMQKDRGR